jgi:hypothetical protein
MRCIYKLEVSGMEQVDGRPGTYRSVVYEMRRFAVLIVIVVVVIRVIRILRRYELRSRDIDL